MDLESVLEQLAAAGNPRIKKYYQAQGAREPLFGVPVSAMNPIARTVGRDQSLAEQLYATGNYDAMYFAGMIADPAAMTEADFDRWLDAAYAPMVGYFILSVSLAETPFAEAVAQRWIADPRETAQTAGWSCYEWLLGFRKDDTFDPAEIQKLLDLAVRTIHDKPDNVRRAMLGFVAAVGVSFRPLHAAAVAAAGQIGKLQDGNGNPLSAAADAIRQAADKGRLGFKRKKPRC